MAMPCWWVLKLIISEHTHIPASHWPEGQIGDSERVRQVRCHCSKVSYHSPVPRSPLQCVNVCVYRLNLTQEHSKPGRTDSVCVCVLLVSLFWLLFGALSSMCFFLFFLGFWLWLGFFLHSDVISCHKSCCKTSFAERCLSLCCIRKQGSELASAAWCHVKSLAPCSPLLHISPARFTSRSRLTFFSFFFCCNFSLKLLPLCLSLFFSLSLCLSAFLFYSRPTVRNHYRPTSLAN